MTSIITQSWKLVTSAGLVSISYFSTWYLERKKALKKETLDSIDEKLEKLYGPLYGHCFALKASYASVLGPRSGMKEYLNEAEEKKDAKAIRRWRSFVWNNIRPLEREINQVLTKNAHLIADKAYPCEFDDFLNHSARLEFIIERWKNQWGLLETTEAFTSDDYLEENNTPGEPNYTELFDHVSQRYRYLQEQKEVALTSLSGGVTDSGIVGVLSIIK